MMGIDIATDRTEGLIEEAERYSANNYEALDVVIERGDGVWVWDVEGRRYLDMLSAYSALNQGHRHPAILRAAHAQLDRLTLTSRAFHNDQLGPFLRELCAATGYEQALPMNSGAEAVETAIKLVRKWGYQKREIPDGQAEIVVCRNNFHGRTTTVVGFSSEAQYQEGFGPFAPGFKGGPVWRCGRVGGRCDGSDRGLSRRADPGRGRRDRSASRLSTQGPRDL